MLQDVADMFVELRRERDAIPIYQRILRMGVKRVMSHAGSRGVRWARSLLNDCRVRLGSCYSDIGEVTKARTYFRLHLRLRRGGASEYERQDVVGRIDDLERRVSERDEHAQVIRETEDHTEIVDILDNAREDEVPSLLSELPRLSQHRDWCVRASVFGLIGVHEIDQLSDLARTGLKDTNPIVRNYALIPKQATRG